MRDHKVGAAVSLAFIGVIATGSLIGSVDKIKVFIESFYRRSESATDLPKPLRAEAAGAWRFERTQTDSAPSKATIEVAHLVYDHDGFPTLRVLLRNALDRPTTVQAISVVATYWVGRVGGGGRETVFSSREIIPTTYVIDLMDIYSVEPKSVSDERGQVDAEILWNLPNPILIAAGEFVDIGIKLVASEEGYITYPTRLNLELRFSFVSDRGIIDEIPTFSTFKHLDPDKMYIAAGCTPGAAIGNIRPARRLCE